MDHKLCVPCLLGLEGPIAEELRRMDMDGVSAENGRVFFSGGDEAIARANICLRIGERVLIELGRFEALSFEQLFQGTRALPWESLIPADGAFPVKGYSLNSKLFSISDCQKIIKKAIVERLKSVYGIEWFPETGGLYQVQFSIMKDQVSLCIDTSGEGLHKRGYRPAHNAAPLKETMAAAMVTLSRYRGRDDFCDPFCGSGTIPIEAALIAKNRAPGLYRRFAAMSWKNLDGRLWDRERERARSLEFNGSYNILGSDIDGHALELARENARRAGVADIIRFEKADARSFDRQTQRGVIVTNPPYGQRIMEQKEAEELYRDFGRAYAKSSNWQLYLLSAHTEFERCFGRPADKKRKLYNGMIKCDLFMYLNRGVGK
ncbi:MAG TPA: class I SAM-dependent RNA methyltransferase [Candidatus Limivicinus faecipullorum]|nr:class I SAM-dependent RNA methyltransferase [Candidatus Limivicinus faecipullorum]